MRRTRGTSEPLIGFSVRATTHRCCFVKRIVLLALLLAQERMLTSLTVADEEEAGAALENGSVGYRDEEEI